MITARVAKVLLFAAALGVVVEAAQATSVTWVLDGVKFSDGGTAIGSFAYDASANAVVDWNIHFQTPDVNFFPHDADFTGPPGGGKCDYASVRSNPVSFDIWHCVNPASPNPFGLLSLTLEPAMALTENGGRVRLVPGVSYRQGSYFFHYGDYLPIVSGSLTTQVPEPSEALVLALGLAALVGFSVRRALLTSQRRTTQ